MVHAFKFDQGKVKYTAQYVRSEGYNHTRGMDPCKRLLGNAMSKHKPAYDYSPNTLVTIRRVKDVKGQWHYLTNTALIERYSDGFVTGGTRLTAYNVRAYP
jgi:hypothetical protein